MIPPHLIFLTTVTFRFVSYEWCKTAMTKALAVGHTDDETETINTPSHHEQLTIPLISGAFAAASAWVCSKSIVVVA